MNSADPGEIFSSIPIKQVSEVVYNSYGVNANTFFNLLTSASTFNKIVFLRRRGPHKRGKLYYATFLRVP